MKRLTLVAPLLALPGCFNGQDDSVGATSGVLMDLGEHNATAAAAYKSASGCEGAEVVIGSFGNFQTNTNVTGQGGDRLVQQAAGKATAADDKAAAQANQTTNQLSNPDGGNSPTSTGTATAITTSDTGTSTSDTGLALIGAADVQANVVDIDGTKTCVVKMPVNPIGPAVLQGMVAKSGAKGVYVLGQRSGNGFTEVAAGNVTGPGDTYYGPDGKEVDIKNTSDKVVESDEKGAVVRLSWDHVNVADKTQIDEPKPGDPGVDGDGYRRSNNYICNATAYIMEASKGREVEYVPGLKLTPLDANTKTGFLHVSDKSTPDQVAAAMRTIVRVHRGGS